jgi:hypothetical protein
MAGKLRMRLGVLRVACYEGVSLDGGFPMGYHTRSLR